MLPVRQLDKQFPAHYGTRRFITVFTTDRHLSLSWDDSTHSTLPSHFLNIHFSFPQHTSTVKLNTDLSILSQGLRKCTLVHAHPVRVFVMRYSHSAALIRWAGCSNLNYWTTGLYEAYGGQQYETRYTSKRFEQRQAQKARNLQASPTHESYCCQAESPKAFLDFNRIFIYVRDT